MVGAPAVRADQPFDRLAQKRLQARRPALQVDDEKGRRARHRRPQPAFLAGLFPPGFVEMFDRLGADVSHRFFMSRFERGTDFLFEIGDAAERDMDAEDVLGDLFRQVPLRQRGQAIGADQQEQLVLRILSTQVSQGAEKSPAITGFSANLPGNSESSDYPQGDSNPCLSLERAMS